MATKADILDIFTKIVAFVLRIDSLFVFFITDRHIKSPLASGSILPLDISLTPHLCFLENKAKNNLLQYLLWLPYFLLFRTFLFFWWILELFFRDRQIFSSFHGRGWENGGLMCLIRGVALVIGRDTTRARVWRNKHQQYPYLQRQVALEMAERGKAESG